VFPCALGREVFLSRDNGPKPPSWFLSWALLGLSLLDGKSHAVHCQTSRPVPGFAVKAILGALRHFPRDLCLPQYFFYRTRVALLR